MEGKIILMVVCVSHPHIQHRRSAEYHADDQQENLKGKKTGVVSRTRVCGVAAGGRGARRRVDIKTKWSSYLDKQNDKHTARRT